MPKKDQGVFHDRYQVVPRTLIFMLDGDKVLLLKGEPHKRLWANLYNGVGGHVERGEDVFSSATRELKEETGIVTDRLRLCGSILIDASEMVGIHLFVFKGIYSGDSLLASNEGSLEWIKISELSHYPLVEDLTIILPEILNLEDGKMVYAHYEYGEEDDRLKIRHFIK